MLDLGCVPGAWLQVACQQIGPRDRGGLVLGVDLQEPSVPPRHCDDRVRVLQADARLLAPQQLEEHAPGVRTGAPHAATSCMRPALVASLRCGSPVCARGVHGAALTRRTPRHACRSQGFDTVLSDMLQFTR